MISVVGASEGPGVRGLARSPLQTARLTNNRGHKSAGLAEMQGMRKSRLAKMQVMPKMMQTLASKDEFQRLRALS